MAFDLTRTRYSLTEELPLAPAANIAEEGAIVKSVLVNGSSAGTLTDGSSATEAIAGFAINNNLVPDQRVIFETATVPASGAATVQLSHGSLVTGQVYVYNVTGSAALAMITSGNPTAGQVLVNLVSGLLTFNVAVAGAAIQVKYRYNLTVQERDIIFRQRPVNAKSNSAASTITVGRGNGNLYTDQYDVTADFSAVTGVVYAGANGLITTDNTKTPITSGTVIHVPTAADPYLGIKFNLA